MIKRKRRSGSETRRKRQSQSSEKKLAAREKALAVQPSREPKCSFCGLTDGTLIKNDDATAFICSKCLVAGNDAIAANDKLAELLEVLVHRMNQHGFGERVVPQLVDAKPTFNVTFISKITPAGDRSAQYLRATRRATLLPL
jgi:hypothetical protein